MPLEYEWVERLFVRFEEIYGATFTQFLNDPKNKHFEAFFKSMVFNMLDGLTNAEIKRGLYLANMYNYEGIPHPVKFWHWAKGIPYKVKKKEQR